jgi:hypothetical protein
MTQILIAHPNADMVDEIKETLDRRFDEDATPRPMITYERNGAFALKALEPEPPEVVVIDLELPTDRRSGPVPLGGLHFAEAAHARHPALPLVLIASSGSPELSARVDALGNAALVLQGHRFDSDLQDQVLQGLARAASLAPGAGAGPITVAAKTGPPVRYLIEFTLRASGHCTYRVWSENDRVPYAKHLPLEIPAEKLEELRAATARLPASPNWARDYEAIGENLICLLLSNKDIALDLGALQQLSRERAGSQIAICFVVDEGAYPIALEALRGAGTSSRKYWLEWAPIWRQLDNMTARRTALFQDAETRDDPIDCLVVEADAEGKVDNLGLDLQALRGVEDEARWLVQHLRAQRGVKIGRIGRIRVRQGQVQTSVSDSGADPNQVQPGTFAEVLEELLTQQGPWHLVHFAGHSHYDDADRTGYVILPGPPPAAGEQTSPEPVGTRRFAKWLAQTQLVYMSSCRGSSPAFVYDMCTREVAAVTGFRWNIKDDTAVHHSRRFYEELFKRRSIEEALHHTWNHMYECYSKDRVWISSELVMQLTA